MANSCGVGALGRLLGRRDKLVITNGELNLKRGDHILLGIPERGLLRASMLVYGLPLLLLFVAATVAHLVGESSEVVVSVSALGGFFGGLYISSVLVDKRYATQLNPQVLQVNNEPIKRI